ncbi:MAG: PEGA domain-containing protein [Myxococcota bacterium]|nr:PEGA domain-containing protein [Myxococcota bacterium]
MLGLPEDAKDDQLDGAASRLRDHIRKRQASSDEAPFREARQAELDALERSLAGSSPTSDAPPPARRRLPRPAPHLLWLVLLILVAVGAIRYGLSHRSAASTPQPPAQLSVLANPQGASFWLLDPSDESVLIRDTADGRRSEWPAGDYRLRVEHPDCPDDWSREVTLPAGGSKAFEPRLCQGEGQVVIRGAQSDDRVQIDGLDVGSTSDQPRTLRVGKHRVRVEKEGFLPFTAEIALRPDEEINLMAALKPKPDDAPPPSGGATAAAPPPPPPARGQVALPDTPRGQPRPSPRSAVGGSKTWHDAIKHELITTYDQNGSGSLDTREEVLSIPCSVWLDIERQYETGGLSVDMTHMYGFDGTDAPANTLGITYGLRGEAYQRMKDCGLKGRL